MSERIKPYTDRIRTAVYGEEVRGSIADAIDLIDETAEGDLNSVKSYAADVKADKDDVTQLKADTQGIYSSAVRETSEAVSQATALKADVQTLHDDSVVEFEQIKDATEKEVDKKVALAEVELERFTDNTKLDLSEFAAGKVKTITDIADNATEVVSAGITSMNKIKSDTEQVKSDTEKVYSDTVETFEKTKALQIVSVGGLTFSITEDLLLRVSWEDS